mmetsp:Transcript_79650/g.200382  ORF Transcript_79650/g.200382 Transcript_79650/m.200382 type:complete len:236 (-) Transcript_79650:436-1143(-)
MPALPMLWWGGGAKSVEASAATLQRLLCRHHLHANELNAAVHHLLLGLALMECGRGARPRSILDHISVPSSLRAKEGRVDGAVLDTIVKAQAHEVHVLDAADTEEVRQVCLMRKRPLLGNARQRVRFPAAGVGGHRTIASEVVEDGRVAIDVGILALQDEVVLRVIIRELQALGDLLAPRPLHGMRRVGLLRHRHVWAEDFPARSGESITNCPGIAVLLYVFCATDPGTGVAAQL